MPLKNAMEDIVRERMEVHLQNRNDICTCEKCVDDIMAAALNLLQPKYVNSLQGSLFVKADNAKIQNIVDVDVAVTQAIDKVHSKPRH